MSRAAPAWALIVGAAGGIAIWWAQVPAAPRAHDAPPSTAERRVASGQRDLWRAPPTEPRPEAARRDRAEAHQPAPVRPVDTPQPYRFMGISSTGTQTAVVLFGKGRVITLTGPGRLDDEHAVEHVADDYLVIRHLPSGRGQFVAFTVPVASVTR